MKILLVHNRYQQSGGEDEVFCREAALLRSRGHQVFEYVRHNDEIRSYGLLARVSNGPRTIWAWDSVRDLRKILRTENPQVAHFHNTFPLISPAAYYACNRAGVPVVQTLHNPRLLCPAATLFRDGHLCEECVGKPVQWPGILHSCYRNSRVQTGVVATMLATHRALGTWKNEISAFLCSSQFYRRKFAESGLPSDKILYKPHFVPEDPGHGWANRSYALFIGRLAAEKGIETLVRTWSGLTSRPIKIRGEGPMLPEVQRLQSSSTGGIDLVPRLSRSDLFGLIKGARFLVWPSLGYYETFGLVAIEAFACGVPVIASRIGVMEELIRDGYTGLHFTAGDSQDLAAKIEWAWTHPAEMDVMGRNARAEFKTKYTSDANYELLMTIYSQVIARGVVSEIKNPSERPAPAAKEA